MDDFLKLSRKSAVERTEPSSWPTYPRVLVLVLVLYRVHYTTLYHTIYYTVRQAKPGVSRFSNGMKLQADEGQSPRPVEATRYST